MTHPAPLRDSRDWVHNKNLPVEYYVLKQGRTQGPFTEAEIVDQLSGGRFSSEDLGQADGARHWTPLRRLFGGNGADTAEQQPEAQPASLPQGFAPEALQWWKHTSSGIQALLHRYPLETGLAFLALGCLLLLLTYVRIFIVGPVLVGALFGGGFAMLRGRVFAGLGLCAAAVFIPALVWSLFFWVGRALAHS